jgi:outer membrane protein TolC
MNTSRNLIFVGMGAWLTWGQVAIAAPIDLAQPGAATNPTAAAPTATAPDYQLAAAQLPLTLPPVSPLTLAPSRVRLMLKAITPNTTVAMTSVPVPTRLTLPVNLAKAPSAPLLVSQTPPKLAPGQSPAATPIAGLLRRLSQTPTQPAAPTSAPLTPFPPGASPTKPAPTVPPSPVAPPAPTPPSQIEAPKFPNFDPNAPAPNYLNPPPNPLSFPTKPEEVKLVGLQPLSLKQALEVAARNNRTLETARLQLERSQAVLREAQAALFPTLSTELDLNRTQSASGQLSARLTEISNDQQSANNPFFTPQDPALQDPVRTSLSGTITLNYNVFTSGLRSAQIRAAEKQVRVSELTVEQNLEQTRLDVATDYYNLQEADQQVLINQAAVRNSEQSLRDTVAQERAGLGTRFDVLRSQVQLANAQQQLVSSLATQKIRRRQLAQRLSLAEAIDLYAADPVQPAGTWKLSLEESVVLAYKNSSGLEAQLVQREAAEQNRKVALSALGPTVSVSAQYNVLDIFEQPVRTVDGYTLAAQARWTLFDGGLARARARQSEKNKQIAEVGFADVKNQTRLAVEQSYATLQSNLANIDTATQAENQAGQSLYLARLRFQAGVGTQSDVINAETDLTRAQGNRINAIISYNRSLADLQAAMSIIPRATTFGRN